MEAVFGLQARKPLEILGNKKDQDPSGVISRKEEQKVFFSDSKR